MRKIFLSLILLLAAFVASAQQYSFKADEAIPSEAASVLVQRFTQMLEAGGLQVVEEGADVILLTPFITSRTEVSGQVALTINLKASVGSVEEVFPLKGLGENDADAWERAVKQILPRSKAAQTFVEKLKK
ncbi:MAG: hypothetical protein IJT74_05820 [Bacteroidales bacterium]|jgi:hypothetical protein|nr:hypothetical protein [Bacteroidales bacterium]